MVARSSIVLHMIRYDNILIIQCYIVDSEFVHCIIKTKIRLYFVLIYMIPALLVSHVIDVKTSEATMHASGYM